MKKGLISFLAVLAVFALVSCQTTGKIDEATASLATQADEIAATIKAAADQAVAEIEATAARAFETVSATAEAATTAAEAATAAAEEATAAAEAISYMVGPFVGDDYAEYTMDGASAWASSYEAYVYVHAGDDVLFDGTVLLTSDNMTVGEFLQAAGYENGFDTTGALSGFVYTMGEYVGGTNDCYWTYTINGKSVAWGCDQMHVLEGDFIEWSFAPMVW